MAKINIGFVGMVFVFAMLALLSSSIVAGFFHKDPDLSPVDVTANVGNEPPTVVSVSAVTDSGGVAGTVNPFSGGTRDAFVSFVMDDANGGNDLNLASGIAEFDITGNPNALRTVACSAAATCPACANPATQRNYTCTVQMQYYDIDGVWNVNVSAADSAGIRVENNINTFTYTSLFAVNIAIPSIAWGTLGIAASDFNQTADLSLGIENFGNTVLNTMNVNASQLNGTVTASEIIPSARFGGSANTGAPNPECDITGSTANVFIQDLNVLMIGANLPLTVEPGPTLGLEELHFCIPPSLSDLGLSAQSYSTSVVGTRGWELTLAA